MKQLTPILLAVSAVLCLPAFAQTTDGQRVGTRDDLRACLDANDNATQRHKALKERAEKLSAEAKEVAAEEKEVNEETTLSRLDNRYTGPRLMKLERRQKDLRTRIEALNAAQVAFNAESAALQKEVDAQAAKCNGVAFKNEDLEAVRKEREAAGKK